MYCFCCVGTIVVKGSVVNYIVIGVLFPAALDWQFGAQMKGKELIDPLKCPAVYTNVTPELCLQSEQKTRSSNNGYDVLLLCK